MNKAGRVLLDTNVVIAIFAGEPAAITRIMACQQAFLPVVVLGELHFGALRSTRRADNIARIQNFARSVATLPCTGDTATQYADIKANLAVKGRPIPDNDAWIAAIAFQHDLTLLTRDAHFSEIEGLAVELLKS